MTRFQQVSRVFSELVLGFFLVLPGFMSSQRLRLGLTGFFIGLNGFFTGLQWLRTGIPWTRRPVGFEGMVFFSIFFKADGFGEGSIET